MQKTELINFFDAFSANIDTLCQEIINNKQNDALNTQNNDTSSSKPEISLHKPVMMDLINLRRIVRDVCFDQENTMTNYAQIQSNTANQLEDLAHTQADYNILMKRCEKKTKENAAVKTVTSQKVEKALGKQNTEEIFSGDASLIAQDLKKEIELRKINKQQIEDLQKTISDLQNQNAELSNFLEKIDEKLAPVLDRTDAMKKFYLEKIFS